MIFQRHLGILTKNIEHGSMHDYGEPASFLVKCHKSQCKDVRIWFDEERNKNETLPKLFVSDEHRPIIEDEYCVNNCSDVCISTEGESFCNIKNLSRSDFYLTIYSTEKYKNATLYFTNVWEVQRFGK